MTVTDPIFKSLWDAILWELGTEPGIWEVYWETPNFYAGVRPETRAAEAEAVMRRLHSEGWAEFVRRPWSAPPDSEGQVLRAEEVEALVASPSWRADPPLPNGELPDDLNVWLMPTEKWRKWRTHVASEAERSPDGLTTRFIAAVRRAVSGKTT